MKLYDSGIYLVNGHDIIEEGSMNQPVSREEAAGNTMAYRTCIRTRDSPGYLCTDKLS